MSHTLKHLLLVGTLVGAAQLAAMEEGSSGNNFEQQLQIATLADLAKHDKLLIQWDTAIQQDILAYEKNQSRIGLIGMGAPLALGTVAAVGNDNPGMMFAGFFVGLATGYVGKRLHKQFFMSREKIRPGVLEQWGDVVKHSTELNRLNLETKPADLSQEALIQRHNKLSNGHRFFDGKAAFTSEQSAGIAAYMQKKFQEGNLVTTLLTPETWKSLAGDSDKHVKAVEDDQRFAAARDTRNEQILQKTKERISLHEAEARRGSLLNHAMGGYVLGICTGFFVSSVLYGGPHVATIRR